MSRKLSDIVENKYKVLFTLLTPNYKFRICLCFPQNVFSNARNVACVTELCILNHHSCCCWKWIAAFALIASMKVPYDIWGWVAYRFTSIGYITRFHNSLRIWKSCDSRLFNSFPRISFLTFLSLAATKPWKTLYSHITFNTCVTFLPFLPCWTKGALWSSFARIALLTFLPAWADHSFISVTTFLKSGILA